MVERTDISLTFSNLTPERADQLLSFYKQMIGGASGQTNTPAFKPGEITETIKATNGKAQPPAPFQAQAPVAVPTPPAKPADADTDDNPVDEYGVPFNPDLHGQNLKADGSWKMRRGADREAYDQWFQDYAVTDESDSESDESAAPPAQPQAPTVAIPALPGAPSMEPIDAGPPIDYETQFLPLWHKLQKAGALPMADIVSEMVNMGYGDENGHVQDYTVIQSNEAVRRQIYPILVGADQG